MLSKLRGPRGPIDKPIHIHMHMEYYRQLAQVRLQIVGQKHLICKSNCDA